ncbi:hypothetical protein SEA_TAQUITO_30 [Mycobacterium phage Taquito]|uniref:Uncharacterized protein n=2 Tax=Fionnbharthvirus TaxID=2948708 RepID=A0A6G6XSQ6_9CAUD|nr:hypothetical protein I5G69_gp32 [Mycobacterium phage Eponine]YP_009950467.1 hypothetical protein I5G70_gp30 [Mycobacterium phage Taquito]AOT23151.1 hypothetical protein SEA_TAQUITO_30 [Mycobacterium phage Taquito]QIG61809.1 hypothetical protein SEA_EPONINE_32 [Mycobacterium phage Eponine]
MFGIEKPFPWLAALGVGLLGGTSISYYSVRASNGTFLYARPLTPGVTLNADGVVDVTPEHVYDLETS